MSTGLLIKAIESNDYEQVKALVNDDAVDVHYNNDILFTLACYKGHLDIVKLLLSLEGDQYIDIHNKNDRSLAWACREGHADVVELLLQQTGERYIANPYCDNYSRDFVRINSPQHILDLFKKYPR